MFLTVVTPTYNRAHTLERVYKSICKQTFKDFEWIIIDDGSTDNTKEIVEGFINEAKFKIRYYYKENGGRHSALNYSYQFIESEYVINIDSDDEFSDNAFELIYKNYLSIPEEDRERFWCISGRCIDSVTKKMIGKPYPEGINKLKKAKQHRAILKCGGEKSVCRKAIILKQYPFPIYSDTKFVPENIVWEKISQKYDQFCTNDVFRIYYQDSPDSLGKGKIHSLTKRKSQYYASLFYVNDCFNNYFDIKTKLFHIINLSRTAILAKVKYSTLMSSINNFYKKILVTLGYPLSFLIIKLKKQV